MAKRFALIEDVLKEIRRLESSELVALARKSEEVEVGCRQYMAELQRLEAKGRELKEKGVTMGDLEAAGDWIYEE